ncbi:unnamed protein product [Rotaria sordida]|uniref:C-type lectin domain-containing protein n=1 Tax=Rotaria sordida TaxID=392033 RepID=A0A814A700_9BILA|nr:unnamed protein product [Rotaria sordida]
MRILLLFIFVGFSSTTEHWFIFDQYQFPGFYTPLFTLTSLSNNQQEQKYLSFALSTYDRSIIVDINIYNSDGTIKQQETLIKLNIERANIVFNALNHMIFVVIRDQTKLETYVNCKLIDSYLFYSSNLINEYDNKNIIYQIKNITKNIEYYEITSNNEYTQQQIFDMFSCKQTNVSTSSDSKTKSITIEQPLIRKMQHVVEKVQQRKLRSRRQNNQRTSFTVSSDSLTIIYKPNIDKIDINNINVHTIFKIPQLKFYIQYYPNEHLFNIRFNNENHTEFILYADKSTDRILSLNNNLVIFLHITSTMIQCYINCELIDQEFVIDTFYIENIIRQIINNNQYEYNRQSTLILFNKTIDQIAEMFFCLKLDQNNQDLLPDKYTLRKFTNALDVLVDNLDSPINNYQNEKIHTKTSSLLTTTTQTISAVNIPLINGFGSFKVLPSNPTIETSSVSNDLIEYNKLCSTNENCDGNKSLMICQSNHCICPKHLFWSTQLHSCIVCHDLLIGNRCFRLSNHKSTWDEANDYCQNDIIDDEQEYTMKLVSNLNQTDIQYFKKRFLHSPNHEEIDYMYWIGATSNFNEKNLYQYKYRIKRQIPTTVFRWYDNHEIAQINFHNIWCSQSDYMHLATINNNELCKLSIYM